MSGPHRMSKDQLGLLLATAWSYRGTCARKRVGCVLVTEDFHELSTGYNGPAAGEPHCVAHPCPGVGLPPGTGLSQCEAIHAEANALLRCPDVTKIHTAYCTHSPCLDCVKLLLNTTCRRIVFVTPYAHDEAARSLWERNPKFMFDAVGNELKRVPVWRKWERVNPYQWSLEQHEREPTT